MADIENADIENAGTEADETVELTEYSTETPVAKAPKAPRAVLNVPGTMMSIPTLTMPQLGINITIL
jgi:hypothetical protein